MEDALHLDQNEKEMIEHIICQMEAESGMDRQAALANMRFTFIHKVCAATVVKPHESKEHIRSQKIDRIVTVILDSIINALSSGERVEFRGFGAFSIRTRSPRMAKNPRTGEKLSVDARNIPHFKAGKQLYELLNKAK